MGIKGTNSPVAIGLGDDRIEGFADYRQASGPITVAATATGPQDVGGNQGRDTLVNVSQVIGSAYNDTLSAGPNDAVSDHWNGVSLSGYDGADLLVGGPGQDLLAGGAGDDTIDGRESTNPQVEGGRGDDLIMLGPHASVAPTYGGPGDDRLYSVYRGVGGDGADTLTGTTIWPFPGAGVALWGDGNGNTPEPGDAVWPAGDDSLVGTSGADTLNGGPGVNTIEGGGGADIIGVFDYNGYTPENNVVYRHDIVRETGAGNTLDFRNAPDGARVTADLGAGAAHVYQPASAGPPTLADVAFDSIDGLQGSNGADTLIGAATDDLLFGNDGADSIAGGQGHNRVNGNKGEDTIVGSSSTGDWLLGGQGNDTISAVQSTGPNVINGNIGDDTIQGGSGGDVLRGGQGDDLIVGATRNDWISGDLGTNRLTGGLGADTFHAGAGQDVVDDFNPIQGDRVLLDAGVSAQQSQVGADVRLVFSNGGVMTLENVKLAALPLGWLLTV